MIWISSFRGSKSFPLMWDKRSWILWPQAQNEKCFLYFCWIYHYILFIKSQIVFIFLLHISFIFFCIERMIWPNVKTIKCEMSPIVLRTSHERLTLQRSCDMFISHLIDHVTFFCISITYIMNNRDHINWVV